MAHDPLVDMLYPGICAVFRGMERVADFSRRDPDGAYVLRLKDGRERVIATAAEVQDGSYKESFTPRLREFASEP